ncbi:hypothetical protein JOE55_002076 [Kocuria palustris]|nr:hypothetical protein [Kocuria palustris]MBM7823702.1 hypothetical protein [Kocuria palustris]
MGVLGLALLGQLDVLGLGAPDRIVLLLDAQRVPRLHVVEVLLHDDVAGPRVVRIIGGVDAHPVLGRLALRILGAVDVAEQVALVEELEAVGLVDHLGVTAQPIPHHARELAAHVHVLGPQMQEQIARRGRRPVARALDLLERMQALGAGKIPEPIPQPGADAGHGLQAVVGTTEGDRAGRRCAAAAWGPPRGLRRV